MPGKFGAPVSISRYRPTDAEKKKDDGIDPMSVIGGTTGAIGGAKMGAAAGAKASPYLAAIPVVGPGLAVAAPAVGGLVGGGLGAYAGAKTKNVSPADIEKVPKDLSKLRSTIAQSYFK